MGIDLRNGYMELLLHAHHNVVIAPYGHPEFPMNVAIECEDCGVVLLDFNKPEKVKTEDGYVFELQDNGTWSDGDMTFNTLNELHREVTIRAVIEED